MSFIGRKYVNFNKNFFQLLFLFLLLTALFFLQLILQLKLISIIQLLTVTVNCHLFFSYFSISVAVTVN